MSRLTRMFAGTFGSPDVFQLIKKGNGEMKDYLLNVPRTDEEVEEQIRQTHGDDNLTTRNMIGIYRIRRLKGEDVLTAWETTLKAYLEAEGKNNV